MIHQIFISPFSHVFMQHALLAALCTGIICALLSCYLVLKGWSLMGDAISHAVLPGVVIAHVFAWPLSIGAFFSGMCCSLCVGYLKNNSRIKEDTAMGIVFSGMFAMGLVLFTKVQTEGHLMHILFGNVLGVGISDLREIFIIFVVVFSCVFLRRRDFLLYCFDAHQSKITGASPVFLHYFLLSLLALTIVSAMQIVGVILVVAMLISPGITGFLLARSFDGMIFVALGSSVFTSVTGVLLSYHIDAATGPVIILLQAMIFLCAMIWVRVREKFRGKFSFLR